jgi:hypothetical protein
MDAIARAQALVAEAQALRATLRRERTRLRAQRAQYKRACDVARTLRTPTPHDLMPLDLAAATIFRRVYQEALRVPAHGRPRAHLDGLAYTIAEMAPVYVYQTDGRSVRELTHADLAGGLFQGGASVLAYVDGRPPVRDLAVSVRHVRTIIETLIATK